MDVQEDTQEKIIDSNKVRALNTQDIDHLALFQINKNRRYTQLQSGVLNADYAEVNLGELQIFRESLSVGARIEAAPVASFVPFATVYPDSDPFSYCGKADSGNGLLQATGGLWDACFKGRLHYIGAAFNREWLNQNLLNLTGEEIPIHWLSSQSVQTHPQALTQYRLSLDYAMRLVQQRPYFTQYPAVQQMLCDTILKFALASLTAHKPISNKLPSHSQRVKGVRRVLEYLHHFNDELPTVAQLCTVAKLSERNLQYAFKEYLSVTPIQYLRLVRLNGVRRDLIASSYAKGKVMDIALRWGFVELGRFSGEYKQLFQELPSHTLRHKGN
ncbi:helix-turn-helix domain-containing protein [Shewanella sp. 125m-7]